MTIEQESSSDSLLNLQQDIFSRQQQVEALRQEKAALRVQLEEERKKVHTRHNAVMQSCC